jgi:HK97 family phage major capsid protein
MDWRPLRDSNSCYRRERALGLFRQAATPLRVAPTKNAIDTLAKAVNQLVEADYQPSGFVVHPRDWLNILLLKDGNGRYLFGDPALAQAPRIWGLPVVATPDHDVGEFPVPRRPARRLHCRTMRTRTCTSPSTMPITLTRTMVAILCEARLTLVIKKADAIVGGRLSYAG